MAAAAAAPAVGALVTAESGDTNLLDGFDIAQLDDILNRDELEELLLADDAAVSASPRANASAPVHPTSQPAGLGFLSCFGCFSSPARATDSGSSGGNSSWSVCSCTLHLQWPVQAPVKRVHAAQRAALQTRTHSCNSYRPVGLRPHHRPTTVVSRSFRSWAARTPDQGLTRSGEHGWGRVRPGQEARRGLARRMATKGAPRRRVQAASGGAMRRSWRKTGSTSSGTGAQKD